MIDFNKIARRETVISDIMESRVKVDKTDGEFHICDFDIVAGKEGEPYAVCALNSKEFINGGFILTRIFLAFVEDYEGHKDACREDFRKSGGINVKLTRKKTRAGRDITTVEVL